MCAYAQFFSEQAIEESAIAAQLLEQAHSESCEISENGRESERESDEEAQCDILEITIENDLLYASPTPSEFITPRKLQQLAQHTHTQKGPPQQKQQKQQKATASKQY